MRKVYTLFFFVVLIISQSGFLAYRYNLNRIDKVMRNKIEGHDYKDQYLLEIKIPLHLPYYSNQTNYKSVTGEINYKGLIYSYVKSKVQSDTLYILCLRNDIKSEWIESNRSILGVNREFNLTHSAYFKDYSNRYSFSFLPLFSIPSFLGLHEPLVPINSLFHPIYIKAIKPYLNKDFIPPEPSFQDHA